MARVQLDDQARLRALGDYRALDTPEEASLDDLTKLTAELLGVPLCLVTVVDRDRQWFKAHRGLGAEDTAQVVAFCDHAIRQEELLIVPDTLEDPRFRDDPLVTRSPKIRFYAGVSLRSPDGQRLGTLCVFDTAPRQLRREQAELLMRLAKQAAMHLELRRRLALLDETVETLRMAQRSREVLAAMVVHDLRSPLTTLMLAVSSVHELADGQIREVLGDAMLAAEAMQRQLMDIIDVCLASSGALVPRTTPTSVGKLVGESVAALQRAATRGEVEIEVANELACDEVEVDPQLIRRLFDNLLNNALKHAPSQSRVRVRVDGAGDDDVRVRISDEGPGIPEADRERVFELLASGDQSPIGRGIGLTFCAEVARVHGGTIGVLPSERGATVAVVLPRHGAGASPD